MRTAREILSDDRIVSLLTADGVNIARRTVAKYREAMRIPSSVERRRLKSAVYNLPETPLISAGLRGDVDFQESSGL